MLDDTHGLRLLSETGLGFVMLPLPEIARLILEPRTTSGSDPLLNELLSREAFEPVDEFKVHDFIEIVLYCYIIYIIHCILSSLSIEFPTLNAMVIISSHSIL
jgi:hypothetical protein